MALRPVGDVAAARWFETAAHADPDWSRPITRGPEGFAAYAVLHHPLVDGAQYGVEGRVPEDGTLDPAVLGVLTEVLARHTSTPDTCWFALWDGHGGIEGGAPLVLVAGLPRPLSRLAEWWLTRRGTDDPPAFDPEVLAGPRVRVPQRDYLLFTGPLAAAGRWGAADLAWGPPRDLPSPSVWWPDDRAWCVTTEVDSAWTGVAGSQALLDDLLADDRLDVEPHDADRHRPTDPRGTAP